MKLLELSYKTEDWELQNLQLGDVNLLVGKNATGKSRTLKAINWIYQSLKSASYIKIIGKWSAKFENNKGQIIHYHYEKKIGVLKEKMTLDGQVILERTEEGQAEIRSFATEKVETFFPPDGFLVLHSRRDKKAYPIIEDIINWAERSYSFKFSNEIHFDSLYTYSPDKLRSVFENIPLLFSELPEKSIQHLKKQMNEVGYEIEELSVKNYGEIKQLEVKEPQNIYPIAHYNLSQGMYRALACFAYIEYLITKKQPAIILIDDLCEGLDYERATKLGKLVFEKCKNSNVQLVATSNDSFLMDVVDIKYWNVLEREGQVVKSLNYKSNPEVFENFKFTGLSNFDFFSSDYIKQKTAS